MSVRRTDPKPAWLKLAISCSKGASMFLSVFDVFKIGVGPSSSHTMGPMSAANRFLELILSDEWPRPSSGAQVAAIKVSLHGSLAHTGIGHGTGRAVILGLMGEARAAAMDLSDQWIREGKDPASPLLEEIATLLVQSYRSLSDAVGTGS